MKHSGRKAIQALGCLATIAVMALELDDPTEVTGGSVTGPIFALGNIGIACLVLASQAVVVPISVPPPVYPGIAESALVSGDVVVKVVVRPDGSVASTAVESGPSLLRDVALKAAGLAKYECRGCFASTPYSLKFRFELVERNATKRATGLTFDREHSATVNVVGVAHSVWEGTVWAQAATPRVRSPKCLWLWRCGQRGTSGS